MTWNKADLAEVLLTIESGSRPKGGASVDSGEVSSLGGENIIQTGGITLKDVKRVPITFYNSMAKGHLQAYDVLINKDGANTGKVGLYLYSEEDIACINEHLFLLRGDPEKITQSYLYYSLLSEHGQAMIRNRISGSAQPGLKSSFVIDFVIDLPESIEEQTQIATILSTIDKAIEQTEAIIAKQQRIKTGLMQDLLTRGIDEHGNIRSEATHAFKDSPLGRIPVEWEVYRLHQLTEKIIDGTHHTPQYIDHGVPFVTVKNLTMGSGIDLRDVNFISQPAHKSLYRRADPKAGDVLVTKDGTLGVARIVTPDLPEFSIFVSVAQLRRRDSICIPELIWAFFESKMFEAQMGSLSAGTGLRHIHLEHFREFLIATPNKQEQERMFAVLSKQESQLKVDQRGLQQLFSLKTGLMQDLLTGNVRVTDLLKSSPALATEIDHALPRPNPRASMT